MMYREILTGHKDKHAYIIPVGSNHGHTYYINDKLLLDKHRFPHNLVVFNAIFHMVFIF